MSIRHTIILLSTMFIASGCASMSKTDCLRADWTRQGIEDGRKGSSTAILDRHSKACAKVSVVPNKALYLEGHAQGVRAYCTPDTGLSKGRANALYQGVCPADLEPAFLASYIDGLEIKLSGLELDAHIAESRLASLRLQQSVLGEQVSKKLLADIRSAERAVRYTSTTQLEIRQRIARLRIRSAS